MDPGSVIAEPTHTAKAGFEWLRTGEDGLNSMLAEIAEAKVSIRLETYIFHTGPLAEEVLEALVLACQRGVKVQQGFQGTEPAQVLAGSRRA